MVGCLISNNHKKSPSHKRGALNYPVELAKRAKYKPPAMRVRDDCYTKKSPYRYNKVVQADI